ncbi:MAG: hypothetical protein PVI52_00550 [Chromatiales bacterium]|jgi:hypothetical protein
MQIIDSRIIKRYNAYYHGWCLAFGEHSADYGEDRDVSWLFGDDRVGLILSTELRKQAQREFLGHQQKIPQLGLSDTSLRMNHYIHPLTDDNERRNQKRLIEFLLSSHDLHMFLSSHLIYPPKTRIITFAKKKPLIIMYKEMRPLQLIIE